MTTTTPDTHPGGTEAQLRRAVCLFPAEDTPRVLYADWLDENDQPERAEFIRVQCELARLLPDHNPKTDEIEGHCIECNRVRVLRRRERELWGQRRPDQYTNGYHWFTRPLGFSVGIGERTLGLDSPFGHVSRGFVSHITLPLAALTDEFARRVWSREPVERVAVSNWEPEEHTPPHDAPNYSWYSEGFEDDRATLPDHLFDALGDPPLLSLIPFRCAYPTRDAALAALSAAVVRWARGLAGPGG